MNLKIFRLCFYIILILLITLFYTKNLNIFGNKFYKNIKKISNPNDIDVLVNKNNKLDNKYVPTDLIMLNVKYSNQYKYLREEAAYNFEKLSSDVSKLNYKIVAVSTYRSYIYQKELFNYYVKSKGEKKALKCSAKPGHSEHQTGLAVDVMGSNNDYDEFEKSIEFDWMKNNSYKYGFILRYPKGKEHITGFKYEPWHYRYVGVETATKIYNNNLTLEEYKKSYTNS